MPKRLGITEQEQLNDAVVEEMVDIETAIDKIYIAYDHLNRLTYRTPLWHTLGKSINRLHSDLKEFSITFYEVYKEYGKHLPL